MSKTDIKAAKASDTPPISKNLLGSLVNSNVPANTLSPVPDETLSVKAATLGQYAASPRVVNRLVGAPSNLENLDGLIQQDKISAPSLNTYDEAKQIFEEKFHMKLSKVVSPQESGLILTHGPKGNYFFKDEVARIGFVITD